MFLSYFLIVSVSWRLQLEAWSLLPRNIFFWARAERALQRAQRLIV